MDLNEYCIMENRRQLQYDRLKRVQKAAVAAQRDITKQQHFKICYQSLDATYKQWHKLADDILAFVISDPGRTDAIRKTDIAKEKEAATIVDDMYWQVQGIYLTLFGSTSNATTSNVKLQKLNLKPFSGKFPDWQTFIDLYDSAIHTNPQLSEIEKFSHLHLLLTPEPLSIIKCVQLSGNNYSIAYNQLRQRYDNKRLLANTHWQAICQLPNISDTSSALIIFLNTLTENLAALGALGLPTNEWSFILVDMVFKRIPKTLCAKFEEQNKNGGFPTFDELKLFLSAHAKALETVEALSSKKAPISNVQKPVSKPVKIDSYNNSSYVTNTDISSCPLCKSNHHVSQCRSFLSEVPQKRYEIAKQHRLCVNCLSNSHNFKFCNSTHLCKICKKRHHSTLHFDKSNNKALKVNSSHSGENNVTPPISDQTPGTSGQKCVGNNGSSVESNDPNVFTSITTVPAPILLATAMVHVKDGRGHYQLIRALIDNGSTCSFITERCLNRLGLHRSSFHRTITGINPNFPVTSKGITHCEIKPAQAKNPILNIDAVVLPNLPEKLPACALDTTQWHHIRQLNLADPEFNKVKAVELLLGAEVFAQILLSNKVAGDLSQPVAIETVFGYILMGKISHPSPTNFALVTSMETFDLKSFWELEQVPQQEKLTPEEKWCEQQFTESCTRTNDGRYMVALPFKKMEPTFMGDSRTNALKRFFSLEKRCLQDEAVKISYSKIIQEYLDSGHMEEAPPCDTTAPHYTVPHFAVLRPDSSTTQVRIVFDCSAKTSEGYSLNDLLCPGPKLQTDIISLLLRFRLHTIVIMADIKQMFRQILMDPKHRNYQRLLWRFDPQQPVKEYRLTTVAFGNTSSPFLALRTIKQLVSDEGKDFPMASKALEEDTFVDDIISGADNLELAQVLCLQLIELLQKGKFELRKWASNSPNLLKDIPVDHRQHISFDSEEDSYLKILGLQWTPSTDCFSFRVKALESTPTKRSILSDIARIWDPLGYLSPITFIAKHLIQHLWALGCDWDQQLPNEVVTKWLQFKSELHLLADLKLPRYLDIKNACGLELHGFCDSSEKGYCAIIFFRKPLPDGKFEVSLICAKSKVATLKKLSIPRLELCAAVLLSNLIKFVRNTYKNSITFHKTYAWSDSMVALSWIKAPPHRWKTFVANRVSHIQDLVPPDCWYHVKSTDNVADHGSRGLFPSELLQCTQWWAGPEFLYTSLDLDTDSFTPVTSPDEAKIISLVLMDSDQFIDTLLNKYSRLSRLTRVVSYIFRFGFNLRNPNQKVTTALVANDLQVSLMILVKIVQHQYFKDDIVCIEQQKPVNKTLRKLNPFIDPHGVLRVGGRLKNAHLPFESKHPALLPRTHRLTYLIIEDMHVRHMHPGIQTLQFLLNQQFWILSAKRAIKSVVSQCHKCFKVKPNTIQPRMGDLPSFRISQLKAFQSCGVDYCGPFNISLGRVRGAKTYKAWICVFVCSTTKAIHLELVSSLTSESFLAALRRFISRRGRCNHIFSDRGTNFVGAERQLNELMQHATETELIKWSFNPPSAPHFGGLFESGVKSVKTHFYRVVGLQRLTYEEFSTFLVQIEALLNSRPLCPVSSDPNDLSALTPGHFLTLNPLTAPPEPDLLDLPLNRLNRWQLIQRMHQDYWKRWHSEYLCTLQQRVKWNDPSKPIELGSMVLIKNDLQPPLRWLIGRVTELFPGADGVIRVVNVRTAQGVLKRPLVKLCILPMFC